MPASWRPVHQSQRATLAELEGGKFRVLIASPIMNSIQPPAHFTDGRVSCYITDLWRTEYFEGGMTGAFTGGFLNLRPMQAYTLIRNEDMETKMLLVSPRNPKDSSLAEMRKKAMSVAFALDWMKKETFPVTG